MALSARLPLPIPPADIDHLGQGFQGLFLCFWQAKLVDQSDFGLLITGENVTLKGS